MARGRRKAAARTPSRADGPTGAGKRPIEQYDHKGKQRRNNPPVGLVTEATDRDAPKKRYAYDPHLDPALTWAGKAEHTSFEVPTVSLHVHERIDPKSIIEAVRRRNGSPSAPVQGSLFESPAENPPLREAIDFYQHAHAWSNRLIAGDSLLVMNSLLEKEGMAGKVQMVYIDPPYGIRYGSNFQPFVNKRDVKDGSDEDLTQEPEMIRAFRDTWELGIHSYLTYLRDRLLLAKELLNESGSCLVQIGDENAHLVRAALDEVFGAENFVVDITFLTTASTNSPQARTLSLSRVADHMVWYAKKIDQLKYRQLFRDRRTSSSFGMAFGWIELRDGTRRRLTRDEVELGKPLPPEAKLFALSDLTGQNDNQIYDFMLNGQTFRARGRGWRTTADGMQRLIEMRRVHALGDQPRYVNYLDDFPVTPINNIWMDTGAAAFSDQKVYVVQTNAKVIARCLLMTTDPGDLVFDPTCGSGTTAYVAEQWGRRWITCDTSRVAVTLAKQRLMTATFDYYELAHPAEGVGSGFKYRTVPHVTLKSIANNEPPGQETLYDQPRVDASKVRVTGPFTVEAVPAPTVRPLTDSGVPLPADASIARSGETLRQAEWRGELLKTGIRGKNNQMILFSRVEPLGGLRWLHADGESMPNERGSDRVSEPRPGPARSAERVVVSFGPEHAPLEQRQVELAWEEARTLSPRPGILVFAAFQFDPEAAKDIDELTREKTGMTFLKVQMNPDLLTADLKKKRASNESFWLMGQPDVEVRTIPSGEHRGKLQVEVHGFDYYNTKTGQIESGDTGRIALWMLDPDYDGRSVFPRQVFFPLADEAGGWARLARNLRAEVDTERIEAYRGTVSLPFEPGAHRRVGVKIVDDRGIESLKIIPTP
jgi:adenine-specific DNA-methyltransferase